MDLIEVKVMVPVEREIEFYRWFADWREGVAAPTSPPPSGSGGAVETALAKAIAWWKTLKPSERNIWGAWIDAAPAMLTGAHLVELLALNGPRDIPGILSWSGRKGKQVGFNVDWRHRKDPLTGDPMYGIEDVDYADLLRRARDAAEERR